MRSAYRLTLLCLLTSVGVATLTGSVDAKTRMATSPTHPDSAAVAAVVNQFHEVLARGDSVAALALLAPDAVILESGAMETKAQYRSHHLSGDMQFSQAVKAVRTPVKVVVSGETAWTVSTSTTQGDFNGRAINSTGAESMVLSRTPAGWRIRSIHWSSRNRRPAS